MRGWKCCAPNYNGREFLLLNGLRAWFLCGFSGRFLSLPGHVSHGMSWYLLVICIPYTFGYTPCRGRNLAACNGSPRLTILTKQSWIAQSSNGGAGRKRVTYAKGHTANPCKPVCRRRFALLPDEDGVRPLRGHAPGPAPNLIVRIRPER